MFLLERAHELTELRRCIDSATAGSGTGIAVCGEAGAGKSVLVEAACAAAPGVRVLRGACDPLGTPRPLGPFRDVAREVAIEPLQGGVEPMLAEVCEAVYEALIDRPTVLVVEDLHWADLASVEVLRFLARRLEAMPLALVVTYRGDEVGPQHSTRAVLGDFAVLERLTTLRPAPLTVDAVASMVDGSGLDPAQVHSLTGGNPYFVAQVAKDPGRPLPPTVRDAVLARTVDVSPADFEVLQLVAAAPDRLGDRVLPALGVDLATLGRLEATGLLERSSRGLVFRHELARLAIESTIPAGGAAQLHARLLAVLERLQPDDLAVLTHHAVAAGDADSATRHATAAAQQAARTGSHTEAVAFLQTALAHCRAERVHERAALLARLGYEQYMTNRLDTGVDNVTASLPLWREAGDAAGLSSAHDMVAVLEYYNAHRSQAEKHAQQAADIARTATELEYAAARVTRGYLAFQRSDYALALTCTQDASRIARAADADAIGLRSEVITAAINLATGADNARERLMAGIRAAEARDLDELASTGYSNLVYLDVEQRRISAVEVVLESSLAHTVRRDIPICNHWQTGVRSRARLLQGRWRASLEDAAQVLHGSGMPLAKLWPHLVTGLIGLRRDGTDGGHLDKAWQLAESLDEPLRRLPVLSALSEKVWLTGQPDARVEVGAPEALRLHAGVAAAAWGVGELALWLRRLDRLDAPPDGIALPYSLALTGRHLDAADWWHRCGAAYDEAMALADSDDSSSRTAAVERLDLLGATAVADRIRLRLRQDGVSNVPPRPRTSTLANPNGLTNRQLDVAKLVARGLTNAEIAARLYISPKTADHHVSAVLAKLGLPSRRAVVVQAAELGL